MNTHSNNLKCVGLLLLLLSVQQLSGYYDPGVQRWINRDPLNEQGADALHNMMNHGDCEVSRHEAEVYLFVRNNPISLTDSFGLIMSDEGMANIAQNGFPRSPGPDLECMAACLDADPLFKYVWPITPMALVNLKTPGEVLPGASRWTSVDRRLPVWTGANLKAGAQVRRGTIGRIKYVGRYGTAAVVFTTFATSYSLTAIARCAVECSE